MSNKSFLSIILALSFFAGCKSENKISSAMENISSEDMKKYISVLASDEFEGRAAATPGEEKTINYLAEQFRSEGLMPANDGSFFQEVPLVKITADQHMTIDIKGEKKSVKLKFRDDFIGGTSIVNDLISIDNSDIVFVGYGIKSPEYGWNDYEGIDVKGKTVIMMVNDPGFATGDSSLFTGKAMTYYGRWTYKFEEAARQGAKAALIIHEANAAGYPWAVVQNSWSGPQLFLRDRDTSVPMLSLKGWITEDAAKEIFNLSGLDYVHLTREASKRGFTPVPVNLKASVQFRNTAEFTRSNNVAALWPGTDRKDEYIIYTGHWDHFGINHEFKDDSILNGAVDNATGAAALIEIAKAFTKLHQKQNRSILFLSVTGEESGLIGSEYYSDHPLFPLDKTIAVINIDALNILGKTKDMTIIGYGNSQLDNYANAILREHNRYARPDPVPEQGGYFRSDHFSFAKKGVPSLYMSKGIDDEIHGSEWGLEQSEKWIQENYHKPSDNYEPDKWNFYGMTDDIKIYFEIGYRLSISKDFPEWNPKFTFKPLRDSMMSNKVK